MNKKLEMAIKLVDDILSRPNGSDLMYIGNIYYSLSCCELEDPLTKEELIGLTDRICEASGSSCVPLLTAERVDAVRFMLEYGISGNRSPQFTSINADQARKLLLSCDQEVFTDLVDAIAVDGHDYYNPDFDILNPDFCGRINAAIRETVNVPLLEEVVRAAEQTRESELPSDYRPGRIWDETNERYI